MASLAYNENGVLYPQIVPKKFGQTSYLDLASGVAGNSHVFNPGTVLVRVAVENNHRHVHFRVGADAVATAADPMMPTGHVEYIIAQPGQRMSLYQAQGSLAVTVTEILA